MTFKTCLTGLVAMIIVNSIAATLLAITMAAVTMETIATVEVVVAADHLIGGTKNLTVLTLQPDCFIFCIFLLYSYCHISTTVHIFLHGSNSDKWIVLIGDLLRRTLIRSWLCIAISQAWWDIFVITWE